MKAKLKLPRLSMNMEEGTLSAWHLESGATFEEGDILYAIETEKVTTDVEAPCSGTLVEILVPAGEDIEPGTDVCIVDVKQ